MNTIAEIANRLSSLLSEEKFVEAYAELFSDHAQSIDPLNKNEPIVGLANLIEREKQFLAVTKIHEISISSILYAGNYFSIVISLDFTGGNMERKKLEELCLYKVENGKIVSQQFFIG